jgi:hypothetical protein
VVVQVVSAQYLPDLPRHRDDDVDVNADALFGIDLLEGIVLKDVSVELVGAVLCDEAVRVDPVALYDRDVGRDLARVADEATKVKREGRRRRLEVFERGAVNRPRVGRRAKLVDEDQMRDGLRLDAEDDHSEAGEEKQAELGEGDEAPVGCLDDGSAHRRSHSWRAFW